VIPPFAPSDLKVETPICSILRVYQYGREAWGVLFRVPSPVRSLICKVPIFTFLNCRSFSVFHFGHSSTKFCVWLSRKDRF